jgi:phenylpropionate dioxygenase-like ring-hydroxylating dioxygenase large terminal subunit
VTATDAPTATGVSKTGRFPFPMPYGWFKVALSSELTAGEILSRRYFDTELVVWRDGDGLPVTQAAFCAHLGAHLGVGGSITDGCIQCPFHGWTYDASGANVRIPYADRPNAKAHLRTYPTVERAGIVLAWYHPHGAEPMWEVMEVPEFDDPEYGPYEVFEYTIGSCMQEIGENGFDHAHFEFVHSHPKVGTTEKVEFNGVDRLVLTRQQFPSSKGPLDARIDVTGRGPGFAITRYQGLIDASLIGCSTPIDDETTLVTFLFTLKNPDADEHTARVARAFVDSVSREIGQDIPIWEHKAYMPAPALAPSEKPIMEYRRWYSRFYA